MQILGMLWINFDEMSALRPKIPGQSMLLPNFMLLNEHLFSCDLSIKVQSFRWAFCGHFINHVQEFLYYDNQQKINS